MAKVTRETREREIVARKEYQAVVLEMDEDEAQFLRDVLARIGGTRESRRKHQDSLTEALEKAGVYGGQARDIKGSIELLAVPRGHLTTKDFYTG